MKLAKTLTLTGLLTLAPLGTAADLEGATMALCKKMETCTLEQMGDTDQLPPEMKQMIINSVAGICGAMQAQFQSADIANHQLTNSAAQCMYSMAKMSCAEIMGDDQPETKECLEYQELAESYDQ